jgi:hypothetical protein
MDRVIGVIEPILTEIGLQLVEQVDTIDNDQSFTIIKAGEPINYKRLPGGRWRQEQRFAVSHAMNKTIQLIISDFKRIRRFEKAVFYEFRSLEFR